MKKNDNIKKIFRQLSHLLRHDKSCILETGGWRSVDDIIIKTGLSFDELCHIITIDIKDRFEFNNDRTKVRALYGHSVSVDMDYVSSVPPTTLYYGTSINADITILDGLIPRKKNYVRLSIDPDSAANIGASHGSPVVIQIDAGKMVEEDYEFYNPVRGVWLVREVPSRFYNNFSYSFLPNNPTKDLIEPVERKIVKIVCDSNETIATIKKDNIISSMCEFENLSHISFTLHTLGDWLDRHIYIIVVTDDKKCNNDLLNKLTGFQRLCRIILISPRIVNEMPNIFADNIQDIHHILRSFCLLVQGGMPIHIDFNDIYTLLLKRGGEIRFLHNIVKTNSDIVKFWDDLVNLIEWRNYDIIIHMALSEENKELLDSIGHEFINGLHRIQDISIETNCCCCYGYSYNKKIDADVIRISAFVR